MLYQRARILLTGKLCWVPAIPPRTMKERGFTRDDGEADDDGPVYFTNLRGENGQIIGYTAASLELLPEF